MAARVTGVDIAENLIKRAQVTNATREIDSGRLCRWPDILIYSEEITGIILGFDRGQPIVIPAIRRPNPVLAFFHHAGPRLPLASVLLLALLAPGRVLGR
jgi:hypothetical protein